MLKRQLFRDHLSLYWQYYVAVVVALALFAFIANFVVLRYRGQAEMREWPVTTAQVIESEIHELPAGKHSLSTRNVVLLTLSYEVGGRSYVEHYTGSLPRDMERDYASILAVGK